jgi:hypothetical protein
MTAFPDGYEVGAGVKGSIGAVISASKVGGRLRVHTRTDRAGVKVDPRAHVVWTTGLVTQRPPN